MPIVYIHGIAVREHQGKAAQPPSSRLLDLLLTNITWEMVEPNLREYIAPAISTNASSVSIEQAYWGDIGARLAWNGASGLPKEADYRAPSRSHAIAEIRRPINQLVAEFFGDVFCYLNNRGHAGEPGPIVRRILESLTKAQSIKASTGEPIVVLTNSMGGQIMYDIVTHFLPRTEKFADLRVDFWCSVAAQIGLFEEMKLFLESSPDYSLRHGNKVPFPDRRHLGTWWNVWDVDDIISYSVRDIVEGVEETAFHVGKPLVTEHLGYLQEAGFYKLFADHLKKAIAK